MKLFAVLLAIFAVLAYASAGAVPAVYDGPTYELSEYTSSASENLRNFFYRTRVCRTSLSRVIMCRRYSLS